MTSSSPDRALAPLRLIPTALSAVLAIGCYDYTLPPRAIDSHDSIVDDSDSSLETDTGPVSTDTIEDSGSETDTLVSSGTDTETETDSQSDTGSGTDTETQTETDTQPEPDPLPISGLRISSGNRHTCAILPTGEIKCWGRNNRGQLGNGGLVEKATPDSVDLPPMHLPAAAISCGYEHSCALMSTGALLCWGLNNLGQLGTGLGNAGTGCDDTSTEHNTPQEVCGLSSGVAQVSAGGSHTCALMETGALQCWGSDDNGQLGDDDLTVHQNTPTPVFGLGSGVTHVAAGLKHTCAVHNGGLKCWGDNEYGQLGDDNAPGDQSTPADVSGLPTGVLAVSAGDRHTCALLESEAVLCFGSNDFGQLGNGDGVLDNEEPVPVAVAGLGDSSGVTKIFTGAFHSCALLDTGELLCWGRNGDGGQLGNGHYGIGADEDEPISIYPADSGPLDVSGGTRHGCALFFDDNHAECWGYDGLGELGDGVPSSSVEPAPAPVLAIP